MDISGQLKLVKALSKDDYKTYCNLYESMKDLPEVYTVWYDKIKAQADSVPFFFVTLNFKPGTEVEVAKKLVSNVIAKKWIGKYYYTYEQRGTSAEELGTGLHVHLVLIPNRTKHVSEVNREIYNSIKNYVGNRYHVDVKMYKSEFLSDKLDYIQGKKWDPEKDPKIKIDALFREKYFLDTTYNGSA